MQQTKIRAFFKPSSCPKSQNSNQIQTLSSNQTNPKNPATNALDLKRPESGSVVNSEGRVLNKKRSYGQYHLELGQSDFLLHACSVCGMMYARGDEQDEKAHKVFHKDYDQGIPFKGWREERVVAKVDNGDRILLVLDCDPPAQKNKVNQVVKMMEKELGFTERLNHKLCKVYLFVSSHRIAGCLVAEPIRTAHRIISNHSSNIVLPKLEVVAKDSKVSDLCILQFGQFKFQREAVKKNTSNQWDIGAILCEDEALPAVCGVRAVWVAPSKRRKRIASLLLDAARKSFSAIHMVDVSQCAFSSPTSSGKAFASSYSRSESFLIYREDDV